MSSATRNASYPVIIVAGPTASGKSGLAMEIAETLNGIVINADSLQVYKNLRILTARPSVDDEARVPHALYGVIPPSENCSVARWRSLAVEEISLACEQSRIPVVTGGAGMYIQALMEGLADVPDIPPEIRAGIQQEIEENGAQAAHTRLRTVDPIWARGVKEGDRQRLLRGLEVFDATGRPLGQWLEAGNAETLKGAVFLPVVLLPDRETLYERINARFEQMIEKGALEEVRNLLDQNLNPELTAMKAVGVRELSACLTGAISLETAVARAQQASRNYAKRQMTWFRNQIPEDISLFAQYLESDRAKIFSFIRQFMLTNGF